MANAFKDAADVIAELADVAKSASEIVNRVESAERSAREAGDEVKKTGASFEVLAKEVRDKSQSTNDAVKGVLAAIEQHARTNQDLHRDLNLLRNEVVNVRQEVMSMGSLLQTALGKVEERFREQQAQAVKDIKRMVVVMGVATLVILLAVIGYITNQFLVRPPS